MEGLKQTARLEAFSDGVFAIAITLLVLNIQVPRNLPPGIRLIDALVAQWPVYFAFVTSFATIGIMWINHHHMFTHIVRSDQVLLLLNGLLLLGITFVPFPTALVAEYVGHTDEQTAATVYTGTFVVLSIIFNAIWRYASQNRRLLAAGADMGAVRSITRQYSFGPLCYLLAFGLAWVQVTAAIAFTLVMAVFFALPSRILR